VKKVRGGGAPVSQIRHSLGACGEDHGDSSWRSTVEEMSTCIPWRMPYQSRWLCPEGSYNPVESPLWSRFLEGS